MMGEKEGTHGEGHPINTFSLFSSPLVSLFSHAYWND